MVGQCAVGAISIDPADVDAEPAGLFGRREPFSIGAAAVADLFSVGWIFHGTLPDWLVLSLRLLAMDGGHPARDHHGKGVFGRDKCSRPSLIYLARRCPSEQSG